MVLKTEFQETADLEVLLRKGWSDEDLRYGPFVMGPCI